MVTVVHCGAKVDHKHFSRPYCLRNPNYYTCSTDVGSCDVCHQVTDHTWWFSCSFQVVISLLHLFLLMWNWVVQFQSNTQVSETCLQPSKENIIWIFFLPCAITMQGDKPHSPVRCDMGEPSLHLGQTRQNHLFWYANQLTTSEVSRKISA